MLTLLVSPEMSKVATIQGGLTKYLGQGIPIAVWIGWVEAIMSKCFI